MATTDTVRDLVERHAFRKVLIIDDAFDGKPNFDNFEVPTTAGVGEHIDRLSDAARAALNDVLIREDLKEEDWEAGLGNAAFLEVLWGMKDEGALTVELNELVFGVFVAEKEQKLAQLAPLQVLLKDELHLAVEEVGSGPHDLSDSIAVVFLDLFLGVTGEAAAREQAADLIKTLLKGITDRDRPLVVLMSTTAGKELEDWAKELRAQAALLGAKFRVISKSEFDKDGPLLEVLEELFTPLEKAQALAGLIDEWGGALDRLKTEVVGDLRSLDLADCAYLQQFRLQAEGMPLGRYLIEAYGDVLQFRLEGCVPLIEAAALVDGLDFNPMPPAHFLPSEGVNWLTHAMNFVNDRSIGHHGHQFLGASRALELGDLIIKKPGEWDDRGSVKLKDATKIYAVISQACDLQQNKSDGVLLLQGSLRVRSWDDSIKPTETRVDCFRFRGQDYVIAWEKAKLDAWSRNLTDRRLTPGGAYLRIARLRSLPALKAQQIFASNLTRIGTLANPHMVVPVGIKITLKDSNRQLKIVLDVSPADEIACLLKGIVLEGINTVEHEYIVFRSSFSHQLGTLLMEHVDEFHESVRPSVREFAQSSIYLSQFRAPLRLGKKIEHHQLKIDLKRSGSASYSQNLTIEVAPKSLLGPETAEA